MAEKKPDVQESVVTLDDVFHFRGSERIHYLEGMVSKQLTLYTWCEEKVYTLATIDAILLAGATLFIGRMKRGVFPTRIPDTCLNKVQIFIEGNFSVFMMVFMLLPIFISLGITLWHVIPKMRSGATPDTIRNHRSSTGIHKYKNIPEYKNRIDSISADEIYEDLVRQIYGMNTNIWRNQIFIKMAVFFDLAGLVGFLSIMLYLVFNGNGSIILS